MPEVLEFGRQDRLTIDGRRYRWLATVRDRHVLERMAGVAPEGVNEDFADADLRGWLAGRHPRMRIDEAFYSKALATLRCKGGGSGLLSLSESQLRNIAWRAQWVSLVSRRRFGRPEERVSLTMPALGQLIEDQRHAMERWYFETYDERRPVGRRIAGKQQELCDLPSASTLYRWFNAVQSVDEGSGDELEVLKTHYANCGRGRQLDQVLIDLLDEAAAYYCTPQRPSMNDVHGFVEGRLQKINAGRGAAAPLTVSQRTVRRRIKAIDPFVREAGRQGESRALRSMTLVGEGAEAFKFMDRVEIDDWTADLFALAVKSSAWKRMTAAQRALVPRVRCTITVAIDVATRSVVGLCVSVTEPSTATSKTALRSVFIDKSHVAKAAKCKSTWAMHGRPREVVTDGGPPFRDEFAHAVLMTRAPFLRPDQDPRMRGTIEAYFKPLRRLCRRFSGQSFSNVVERGDYKAEDLASVTVANFRRHVVRYTVDSYHNHPHRGIEGRTPLQAWEQLAGPGHRPHLPSEMQMRAAFGMRITRKVSKKGIEFHGVFYPKHVWPPSPKPECEVMGMLLRAWEGKSVDVVVTPGDMGSILVRIPESLKDREWVPDGDFIEVEPVDGKLVAGRSLEEVVTAREVNRRILREQQKAGKEIRLAADRELLDEGREAMEMADIFPHGPSKSDFDRLEKRVHQDERAAMRRLKHSPSPAPVDPETTGELIYTASEQARPVPKPIAGVSPAAKKAPYGGRTNDFGSGE